MFLCFCKFMRNCQFFVQQKRFKLKNLPLKNSLQKHSFLANFGLTSDKLNSQKKLLYLRSIENHCRASHTNQSPHLLHYVLNFKQFLLQIIYKRLTSNFLHYQRLDKSVSLIYLLSESINAVPIEKCIRRLFALNGTFLFNAVGFLIAFFAHHVSIKKKQNSS